jgi:hypothetical protein
MGIFFKSYRKLANNTLRGGHKLKLPNLMYKKLIQSINILYTDTLNK